MAAMGEFKDTRLRSLVCQGRPGGGEMVRDTNKAMDDGRWMMDDPSIVVVSEAGLVWRTADVQDQVNDSDGRDSISSGLGFGLGVARWFGGRWNGGFAG